MREITDGLSTSADVAFDAIDWDAVEEAFGEDIEFERVEIPELSA